MGDTLTPTTLISELATLTQQLETQWRTGGPVFETCELVQEIADKSTELKYQLLGFAPPSAA